jgi:uncharacterized membrane protein YphA (DoxX/SURF4 family)
MVTILIFECTHLRNGNSTPVSVAAMGLAILVGVGLFTSISSAAVAVCLAILTLKAQSDFLIRGALAALCTAVAFLGSGSYSIDGLLRRRRTIVLPKL